MTPREIAALVPWSRVLEEAGVDPGHRNRTRCAIRNGNNASAFVYNEDRGTAHCFSCSWHGDKIDFLQAVEGVDFKTALARLAEIAGVQLNKYRKPDSTELRHARADRAALDAARDSFKIWQRQKFNQLVDFKFQELLPAIEIGEIAYRSLCRAPDFYPLAEQKYWISKLGELYDQIAKVELSFDYLILREYESERLGWWKREEVKNAAAA